MSASRKVYKALAANLAIDIRMATPFGRQFLADIIVTSVAPALKADNPHFRYDTFFEACGLDANGNVPQ